MDTHLRHTAIPEAWLTTPRVRLRPWKAQDRPPFAALNADQMVMAYFPKMLQRAESDAQIDRFQKLINARGWGFWAVDSLVHGPTPQFIGMVGLHTPLAALPFSPCVEIGWRLARPYWGQGLASEAAGAALRAGFEALQLEEIVAFTSLLNHRSQAVMQRLHMQCHPADQFEHPALPGGHLLRPHCLYRLPRTRWAHMRAQPAGH